MNKLKKGGQNSKATKFPNLMPAFRFANKNLSFDERRDHLIEQYNLTDKKIFEADCYDSDLEIEDH